MSRALGGAGQQAWLQRSSAERRWACRPAVRMRSQSRPAGHSQCCWGAQLAAHEQAHQVPAQVWRGKLFLPLSQPPSPLGTTCLEGDFIAIVRRHNRALDLLAVHGLLVGRHPVRPAHLGLLADMGNCEGWNAVRRCVSGAGWGAGRTRQGAEPGAACAPHHKAGAQLMHAQQPQEMNHSAPPLKQLSIPTPPSLAGLTIKRVRQAWTRGALLGGGAPGGGRLLGL